MTNSLPQEALRNGLDSSSDADIFARSLPEVLVQMASPHVTDDSPLRLLPYDPTQYPGQDPSSYHVTGKPVPIDVADTISPMAQKSYLDVRGQLMSDGPTCEKIQEIGGLLLGGNNITVVTSHGELLDIVMANLIVRDMLVKTDEQFTPRRTAMILSKMVTMLEFKLGLLELPAIEAVKLFCHDIFLSFPRTKTGAEATAGLPSSSIKRNNRQMAKSVHRQFHEGSVLLGLAATGTTHMTRNESTGKNELAAVGRGTVGLMTASNTFALPLDVTVSDGFRVALLEGPRQLKNQHEVNDFMAIFNK